MERTAELRVCWVGDWRRSNRGRRLDGDWGCAIEEEIKGRFHWGPPVTVLDDQKNPRETGEYSRLRQLLAIADLSLNPLQEVVEEEAVLYRKPLRISGELAADPTWTWLRENCGLDRALQLRHRMELGIGSAVIRPRLIQWRDGQYHPPGLTVVSPDECIAVADPSAPDRLCWYAERIRGKDRREHWIIWDVTDPGMPCFGRWETIEGALDGRPATWTLEGDQYPWWWNGAALMPVVASQADPAATEPLSYLKGVAQGVKDLILQRVWCSHVAKQGSLNRAVLLSEMEGSGWNSFSDDPSGLAHLFGLGNLAELTTILHSLDAAEILWRLHRDRVREWVSGLDRGLEVRETESAKSGTALLIEMTGAVQHFMEQVTRVTPLDRLTIQALIATFNSGIRSGQIRMSDGPDGPRWDPYAAPDLRWLIPETSFELGYPQGWNEPERIRIRAELQTAVDAGQESPRVLWLLDHDLEDDRPDGPNWVKADEEIRAALADASAYAALGYGLRWQDRYAAASLTPEDETATYMPPADVANEAARGLRLRDAFPGRALDGRDAQQRKLMQRARRLQGQDAFMLGEVRALDGWLRAHEGDASLPADMGAWGNDADPSGAWITWLSQGGEPGSLWTATTLSAAGQPAVTDEPPPAAEPANNSP